MVLHFDPVTKQIWGGGSDNESNSDMEVEGSQVHGETPGGNVQRSYDTPLEDSDEDINAAARLASTVSPVMLPNAPRMAQLTCGSPVVLGCPIIR